MKHAKKPPHILKLEENCPSPLQEILEPGAIKERSKTALALRGAETVDEMIPELTIIARENNLNLNNPSDWKEGVRILRMDNLNKR